MTVISAAVRYPGYGNWRTVQPGASETAKKVAGKIFSFSITDSQVSATGQNRIAGPLHDLGLVFEECRHPDWDGEGADPVPVNTLAEAQNLLLLIPWTIPIPEMAAERSGRIAFEWYRDPERVYLLSIGGRGELEFAGIFGRGNEIHGKCNFSGSLPEMIAGHLRTLFHA